MQVELKASSVCVCVYMYIYTVICDYVLSDKLNI